MELNTNQLVIIQGWFKSRVKEVGGHKNLAKSEILLFLEMLCANEEIFQVIQEYESNQTMQDLFNWVSNLPQEVKDSILDR